MGSEARASLGLDCSGPGQMWVYVSRGVNKTTPHNIPGELPLTCLPRLFSC